MKKTLLTIIALALLLSLVGCDLSFIIGSTTTTTSSTKPTGTKPTTSTTTSTSTTTKKPDPTMPEYVLDVLGVNEQIIVTIDDSFGYVYEVYYKKSTDSDYTKLDDELMVKGDGIITAYILGISEGQYTVEVKALSVGSVITSDIEVLAQDRSGYAHFGSAEGVGAYNNDGTIKEGTKIVYVTNENKNTVTLEIGGTEYTGLVNILQAQYKSDTPMLIRIIGKITTNQWNYKNVEPRLTDRSNFDDTFFDNTFSTEYGENLANLIVKFKDNGDGWTYNYKTTPDGLTDVRKTRGGTATTSYKGSDFPKLSGKTVYDDDSYYNMLEVKGSKNITVEGIGTDAEIFQFGISFEECNNIEIRNLTFTDYPEDALNFLGGDRADLAKFNRYWIHNCTFNRGYNSWDLSGERDKYAGDGTVDFNNVSNATISYNFYNNSKKSMLFGSGDSQACMNMTMHHNYFYKVESRLPLGRNVNMHAYNNYYEDCGNCADLRKNSYIFSEANYFKGTKNPFKLSSSTAKSFGDKFVSSSSGTATVTTDRNKQMSSTCTPDKVNDLMNFDTNPELFYYDSTNGRSDVANLLAASDVPEFVTKYAGAGICERIPCEK